MRDVWTISRPGGAPARRSDSAPSSRPGSRRRASPGASMLVDPDGTCGRQRLRRLRRGRGLRTRRDGARRPHAGAAALRRQRRRRVRGRADLRRDHRHLRRTGQPADLSRARADRRGHPGRPAGGGRDADQRSTDDRVGARAGRARRTRSRAAWAATGSTRRSATTPRVCSGRASPPRCTTAPDGERRGDDIAVFVASYAPRPRMIVFGAIDFAAAVARVGAFLGYRVTVCDARPTFATDEALPGRRRGRGRVAAPLPRRDRGRRAHRRLRAHPRPEVRRAAAGGRAAQAVGLPRRDGFAAHQRGPRRAAARARLHRRRPRPAARADRARRRRPHPGGDGRVGRRRDHRSRWGGSGAQLRHVSGPIHR